MMTMMMILGKLWNDNLRKSYWDHGKWWLWKQIIKTVTQQKRQKAHLYQETELSSTSGTCQVSQSRCWHGKPLRKTISQAWQLAVSEWQTLNIRDDAWLGECWANATFLSRASILPQHSGSRSGGNTLSEQLLIAFSGRNLWPIGLGVEGGWEWEEAGGPIAGEGVGNSILFLAGARLPLA